MSCNSNCSNINIPIGPTGATGPQGPAGQNGTNGTNGTTVLYNNFSGNATTGTTLQTLDSYTLLANQLATVGDAVEVYTEFSSNPSSSQLVALYFNSSAVALGNFYGLNIDKILMKSRISRISANQVNIETEIFYRNAGTIQIARGNITDIVTAGGLNFAGTLAIEARGDSNVIGDITNEYLQVFFINK